MSVGERDFHDAMLPQEVAIFEAPLFQCVVDVAVARILARTGLSSQTRVLSIGCGVGTIERRLARHAQHIVGVDISPVAVDLAKRFAAEQQLSNVDFRVVDLQEPEQLHGAGPFDAVLAIAVLHHLGDQTIPRVLGTSLSQLVPGGLIYSSDPSVRRLAAWFRPLAAKQYTRFHSDDEEEIDPDRLVTHFRQAGFCDISLGAVDLFAGPAAWLAPWMPRFIAPSLVRLDQWLLGFDWFKSRASTFDVCARRPADSRR